MAADAATTDHDDGDETDVDRDTPDDVELSRSQAEGVVMRKQYVHEKIDDVLRDIEADARSEPPRIPGDRLDELDDAVAELMMFSVDLRGLNSEEDDAGD